MQTEHIKRYAPQARTEFIVAMTKQAAKYGISEQEVLPVVIRGDVALVGDRPFPSRIVKSRDALVQKVEQLGFHQAMEQAAYSWFNRLCALRYMELADYLGHGRRVLSHLDQSGGFQILEDCLDMNLPGLDQEKVRELKLDGTKDEELYRELLLAQCHALHEAMPFLFEPVDDATELLLPENLTKTDSLIKELVTAIPEADWANIEIIGWLYQFYISDKKDQVIGKVIASEDIPAATQLFTPNWIVKYMVQNSLGAQWLATYPQSPLKGQMEYYIEPAEQTIDVNAQLAAITPSQLNPEELTLIDPASGSGHILVEAYELFKAIYLERGYRQRDVPQLILEKNLFGLDIDERAVQLTGFALMMKGRADDRRLFERGVKLNVMALVDSAGLNADVLAQALKSRSRIELMPGDDLLPETIPQPMLSVESKALATDIDISDIREMIALFEHATTFGSLIQVPEGLAKKLPGLKQLGEVTIQDLFVSEALKRLGPLVQQAEMLAEQYDAVVANPPYMGGKGMNALLKKFTKDHFPDSKSDLFAASTERFVKLAQPSGFIGLMTPFTWMFLKSYEALRSLLLETMTLRSLIQPQYHTFFESAAVPVCAFTIQNSHKADYLASFIKLSQFRGAALQPIKTLEAIRNPECGWLHTAKPDDFNKMPGSPIAYWVGDAVRQAYEALPRLDATALPKQGIKTGENDRFLRLWHEVSLGKTALPDTEPAIAKWFPCTKGGDYRKWFGNYAHVLNWESDGHEIRNFVDTSGRQRSRPQNIEWFFRPGITWSTITIADVSMRVFPSGFVFESKGSVCFPREGTDLKQLHCALNSVVVSFLLKATSPTLDYSEGAIGALPLAGVGDIAVMYDALLSQSQLDWDAYERSWDFQSLPLLTASSDPTPTIESSYTAWITQNRDTIAEMKRLEEENNRLFIDAYGLAEELSPDVPIEQITLTVNPAYRYGGKLSEEEQWTRFRQDSMEELVSYAIGCMMGRYSLDTPGLVYAHSGNEGFDPSHYTTFPADDDGLVPLTDTDWFSDDAAHRMEEFVSVAWDKAHLEENLQFLADNLMSKRGEASRDTVRRYLRDKFFKDHLQTYKKRPIYWLFSSGKQKAFQCLVYLHRYNEGTLARMRTEYVIPLTAKLASHVEKLEQDKDASSTTAEIKRLEKQIDKLHKQQAELSTFDEKLRHYADQRISLDLDDGVKVNYGRFGDLLAEVKAITGKNPT